MKRIKMKPIKINTIITLASLALLIMVMPSCTEVQKEEAITITQNVLLKGFDDEQEEKPSIVSDGNGEIWMYNLRRISYPENSELISAYQLEGDHWVEKDPVTKAKGQYETPTAACAKNGKPVVAWTEIKDSEWKINVSLVNTTEFPESPDFNGLHTFSVKDGNSISPVLIAPDKDRNWIAWENLNNGKFTIYISKYDEGKWSEPITIDKGQNSCFDPSMAEAKNGDLYIAYGLTAGFHQNIEMSIIDGKTLKIKDIIPVAIGGALENRVNTNSKPAIAFDAQDNLWISYENNHNTSCLDDGDNYTGDRSCAILSYQNGKIVEIENKGKWLFNGRNDHKPTFVKDKDGHLFMATNCGGDTVNGGWKYRMSWLDPQDGWQEPITIFDAKIKGILIAPAITFDEKGNFWLATNNEKIFLNYEKVKSENVVQSRLTELNAIQFSAPDLSEKYNPISFVEAQVKGFSPDVQTISTISGHPRMERPQMTLGNETYTLIYGNLHEHTNSSDCWPAGTDGSLHDDYRFGMFSEGYDFVGMTDHSSSTSEIQWRRNLRMADFYNESKAFIVIPAIEWSLPTNRELKEIQHGVGHYNIVFESTADAQKYIRNKHEIYSPRTPETEISPKLWERLRQNDIECVTIPHHPADEAHPTDWNVTDPKFVTTVEIFQCRGNNEHPDCPRQQNLLRHANTPYPNAFVDFALKTKKYKMGFIASGDHNSMGVGLAALWVKEISRAGIVEALKTGRSFATTGDKFFVDVKLNETLMGSTYKGTEVPEIKINVAGQYPLEKVEILRNSKVIHTYEVSDNKLDFKETYSDSDFKDEKEVLYYYVRVTQKNKALAWSSPIWVENNLTN